MADTMNLTKITAAVCTPLLVLLLVNWAGEEIYSTTLVAHGGEPVPQAYVIDTGVEEAVETVDEGPAFADVYLTADATAGEKVFNKCKGCHMLNGSNGTGPYLNGVINKGIAVVEGYDYSQALVAMTGDVWSTENLNSFLLNPKAYAAGTKMAFAGLKDVEDRANVIKYLETTQ